MGGGEDDALVGFILARRTGAFGGACVGLFFFYNRSMFWSALRSPSTSPICFAISKSF